MRQFPCDDCFTISYARNQTLRIITQIATRSLDHAELDCYILATFCTDHFAPTMSARYSKEQLQEILVEQIAGLLEVSPEQIDVHASFISLGADSIVLLEAIQRIELTFGVKVGMQQFFEALDTIDSLSLYLLDQCGELPKSRSVERESFSEESTLDTLRHLDEALCKDKTLELMQAQINLVRFAIEKQNCFLRVPGSRE